MPGLLVIFLGLTGCQSGVHKSAIKQALVQPDTRLLQESAHQNLSLNLAYDYQIIGLPNLTPLSIQQLAQRLKQYDVIFIGEFHGNHASHLLEAHLLQALHQQNTEITLSMEMFNRDQQALLDQYLDSEIGETFLINEAPAWQNYKGGYRPLIEYAKQNFIPVIAANASADIVRCIGRNGAGYLKKLSPHERRLIAATPFKDNKRYRKKYMALMDTVRKLSPLRKEQSYLAQLTRDNTLAESIYQAWLNASKQQIIHVNGSFHSEQHLGTVSALKALDPSLSMAVITPIRVSESERNQPIQQIIESLPSEQIFVDEALYFVLGQPEPFKDADYKQKLRKAMFSQSDQALCH
ncbi:MAG: ChaN family lipoprotein [Gammaproteobacteria bacterium]|nr:ChaN family lipoprotein [Gammaproteobacteria bacterium]